MSRYIKRIIEVNWQVNILPKDIKYVLNSCKNKFVETILVCIKKDNEINKNYVNDYKLDMDHLK